MSDACDHTDEEHASMHKELSERLANGDISAVIPALSNEALNMLLQAAAAELFIRSGDWDAACNNWEQLDNLVRSTLFVKTAEESAFPVEYTMLREANKDYQKLIELDKSQAEAKDELNDILGQHGVQEANRPVQRDDNFPGFYL